MYVGVEELTEVRVDLGVVLDTAGGKLETSDSVGEVILPVNGLRWIAKRSERAGPDTKRCTHSKRQLLDWRNQIAERFSFLDCVSIGITDTHPFPETWFIDLDDLDPSVLQVDNLISESEGQLLSLDYRNKSNSSRSVTIQGLTAPNKMLLTFSGHVGPRERPAQHGDRTGQHSCI